ncbi:MAG TPA: hypothetical protein VIL78_05410 [Hanamia sp.]
MEKILLAVDAINPDNNSLEFACYLGRLTKSKITGVFLENLSIEERPLLKKVLANADNAGEEVLSKPKEKMELIEKNISFFEEACINREVNYRLYLDGGNPAGKLIEESRFADLLVLDAAMSFHKHYEGIPTEFAREVLKKAECPVIITPESFDAIDEIIFSYDSSSSSLFAIKQFTYLFSQLKDKKVTLLQVNESGEWQSEDKNKFKEWLREHYTDLQFVALKGKSETVLFDYLFKRKNIFLVMGAYGRTIISQFLKHSHADLLMNTITQPIFIAHK